jgi:hypothetical protein
LLLWALRVVRERSNVRRLYILLAAVVIATLLIAVATGASAAPRAKVYGALWGSESLQDAYVGFASNKSDANAFAYNRCLRAGNTNPEYQNDCTPGVWVRNGSMAFAMDSNGSWGSGWAHTKQRAVYHAKGICREHGGTGCATIIQKFTTPAYNPNKPTRGGIPPGGTPPGGGVG